VNDPVLYDPVNELNDEVVTKEPVLILLPPALIAYEAVKAYEVEFIGLVEVILVTDILDPVILPATTILDSLTVKTVLPLTIISIRLLDFIVDISCYFYKVVPKLVNNPLKYVAPLLTLVQSICNSILISFHLNVNNTSPKSLYT